VLPAESLADSNEPVRLGLCCWIDVASGLVARPAHPLGVIACVGVIGVTGVSLGDGVPLERVAVVEMSPRVAALRFVGLEAIPSEPLFVLDHKSDLPCNCLELSHCPSSLNKSRQWRGAESIAPSLKCRVH
jgi:hypothetical protein